MTDNTFHYIDVELGKTIGLIGDLHADLSSLMKIEDQNQDVDHWILLGDVADMHTLAHSNNPIVRFASNYEKFTPIKGNHETSLLKTFGSGLGDTERKMVEKWPMFLTVTFAEFIMKIAHEREHITYPDEGDILAFGHTHEFLIEESKGKWLLNPGLSGPEGFWIKIKTDPLTIESVPVSR